MSSSFEKFQKRRLISSYFSVVLSMFLVLFLLGILGFFIINSKKLSDDFKEEIVMTVFFKNEATDSTMVAFGQELKAVKFVKSSDYVTKEQAAKMHTDIIGEDFMTFLGANPLQNSYDIHLKADYIDTENIRKIESRFLSNEMIADIVYDKQLVSLVNDNIKKVSMWILIISGILALIAVLLINSSMRLSIYSNRFIIKTMQMVGATQSFITRPFDIRALLNGLTSGVIAVIGLWMVMSFAESQLPVLDLLNDPLLITILVSSMIILGILISMISTHRSVVKYLKMHVDDLY